MAIQNASDLLVYLNFPSAVKQVTRIRCINATPLQATSKNVIIKQATASNGTEFTSLTTGNTSANTGNALLTVISAKLDAQGYSVGTVNTDGDTSFVDVTNDYQGSVNTIFFENGTGVIEAGALTVEVITSGQDAGSTPIAHSTQATLTVNREYRDVTTKDSNHFQEHLPGLTNFEITTDALQDFLAELDFQEGLTQLKSGDSVTVKFSQRLTSGTDVQVEGSCKVGSIAMDTGVEDNATYSATFMGTGALTITSE